MLLLLRLLQRILRLCNLTDETLAMLMRGMKHRMLAMFLPHVGTDLHRRLCSSCGQNSASRFLQSAFPPRRHRASSWLWSSTTGVSRPALTMTWGRCLERSAHESASNQSTQRLPKKRVRLDELCLEHYPQYSRTMIQSWILQGKVMVDGKPVGKAGTSVKVTSTVDIVADVPKYVCRAGYKLEAALEQFAHDVKGKIVLDAGLSTGGFTDCLLQNGAAQVYGVDVGYGQVAEKIRTDKRVSVIERTNVRYLPGLPQLVDLVTLDLSFISILLVMPAVCSVMKGESSLITLIKPQFEARRSQVGGGGIVRDAAVHKEVLHRVISGVEGFGFTCQGWIQSPITGAEGNIEFLAYFHRLPAAMTAGIVQNLESITNLETSVEVFDKHLQN